MSERETQTKRLERLDWLRAWILRLGSVFLFALTLDQWIGLVGVVEGPLGRFDLMPAGWRVASATLAVLYPVAGIGLWLLAPWGTVVWFLVAATLAVMSFGFPATFGTDILGLAPHVACLLVLLVLRIARARAARPPLAPRRNTSH
jgi:hypothetical protein